MPTGDVAEWQQLAKANNMSLSDFIRLAVFGFIAQVAKESGDDVRFRHAAERMAEIREWSPMKRRWQTAASVN
jgi:hypothetical protein